MSQTGLLSTPTADAVIAPPRVAPKPDQAPDHWRLAPEQEASLVMRARHGDDRARRRMTAAYLPLVRAIAMRYANLHLPAEDLIQEGCLGLMHAVDRFDVGRGTVFATYARHWIQESIQQAFIRNRMIRMPAYLAKTLHAYTARTEHHPGTDSVEDQASAMRVGLRTVRAVHFASAGVMSLDEPDHETGSTLLDHLEESVGSPESQLIDDGLQHALQTSLRRLPLRAQEILRMRFGLFPEPECLPFSAIGERLGMSRETARVMCGKALESLREQLLEAGLTADDLFQANHGDFE